MNSAKKNITIGPIGVSVTCSNNNQQIQVNPSGIHIRADDQDQDEVHVSWSGIQARSGTDSVDLRWSGLKMTSDQERFHLAWGRWMAWGLFWLGIAALIPITFFIYTG